MPQTTGQGEPTPPQRGQGGTPLVWSFGPLLAGLLLGAGLLQLLFGGQQTEFDQLALGQGTTSVFARVDDLPIHCEDLTDAEDCLAGARSRGQTDTVLWLGNSQLHSVNQFSPGDETAPPIVYRRLRPRKVDLVAFSQPNANLQEHYVLFEYLRQRLPLRALLLPIVFDDLRETGIRGAIGPALRDARTAAVLRESEIGLSILNNNLDLQASDSDLAGVRETFQEVAETSLNGWLDSNFPMWAQRPEARGGLFVGLYRFRNSLFGVTAQSHRRLIPGRYALNLQALRSLLTDARRHAVEVLLYVVPLRDDVAIPYVPAEYAAFKQELARIAADHGAEFVDLQSLVPAELWGEKESTSTAGDLEIDFMHFRAGGHLLLADALTPRIELLLGDGS